MAAERKYNVPLNLLGQELRNAKFQMLAAAPSASEALHYYDSVLHTLRFHNGTEWVNTDARLQTGIPIANLATNPLARANHTGSQTASTISDFDTQVRTSRLDQMAVPNTAVTFNSQRITNVANPSGAQDVATKNYVDGASTTGNAATATKLLTARAISLTGVVTAVGVNFDGTGNISLTTAVADGALSISKTAGLQTALDSKQASLGYTALNKGGDTMIGTLTLNADPTNPLEAATKQYVDQVAANAAAGIDPKESVKVATTTNISLSGAQTVDGVAVVAGDSVLVKNQTTAAQNGIYVVSNTAWVRRSDAVQGKLTQGALMLVLNGTQGGSQWYLQTSDPITIGTTSLTFIQYNVVATYTASNGVQLVGSDFSLRLRASSGLIADSSGVGIDTGVVVRKVSTLIGDGTTKNFNYAHNLNSVLVDVKVYNVTTGDEEYCGITVVDANNVTITFGTATAPATNSYRVVVHA